MLIQEGFLRIVSELIIVDLFKTFSERSLSRKSLILTTFSKGPINQKSSSFYEDVLRQN